VLTGHATAVHAIHAHEDFVITAAADGKIKVWDSKGGKFCEISILTSPDHLGDLDGHTDWVRGLQIWKDQLISCSLDTSVKIWDYKSCQLLTELQCRTPIYSMAIYTSQDSETTKGSTVLLTGCSSLLKIWDLDTFCLMNTVGGHSDYVSALAVTPSLLISGGFDGVIQFWQTPQELAS
jgi:WD40 repeat protein